jgi:hypothetical protein
MPPVLYYGKDCMNNRVAVMHLNFWNFTVNKIFTFYLQNITLNSLVKFWSMFASFIFLLYFFIYHLYHNSPDCCTWVHCPNMIKKISTTYGLKFCMYYLWILYVLHVNFIADFSLFEIDVMKCITWIGVLVTKQFNSSLYAHHRGVLLVSLFVFRPPRSKMLKIVALFLSSRSDHCRTATCCKR